MIKVVESIDTNSLKPNVQTVIDELMTPLADNVIVTYIDETMMPDELSVEFAWEYKPGNEEYIGTWEINMNKENVANYTNYIKDISAEIQEAYAYIDNIKA